MIRFKTCMALAVVAVFAAAMAGCETSEGYTDANGNVPGASAGGGTPSGGGTGSGGGTSSGGGQTSTALKLNTSEVDINVSGSESSFVPLNVTNADAFPGYVFKWKATPTNYGSLSSSSGTSTAFEPTGSGAYAGRTVTVDVTCTATGVQTLTATCRITIHFN